MPKGKVPDSSGKTPTSEQYAATRPPAKTENGGVRGRNNMANSSSWKEAILDLLETDAVARKDLADGEVILEDRRGKPIAVLIDYQHYETMVEKLEDLLDAQSAREGLEALRRGEEETIPWETVKARLLAEGLIDE
jgi:PHD/YefM family antitoxin component YafN of YafNO toxin-antitoxin module